MHLNTAVAAQMELINAIAPLADRIGDDGVRWALREAFSVLARLLAPFAPHVAEELWEALGEEGFVSDAAWPSCDEALLVEDRVTVVVQVNGKLRARLELARDLSRDDALEQARGHENVAGHLEGKTIRRVVFVPNRLLNLVVQ
jgi:leucyl-tRNA synthetase